MQLIDFITKLIVRSTFFGHHHAYHQELKSYTDFIFEFPCITSL